MLFTAIFKGVYFFFYKNYKKLLQKKTTYAIISQGVKNMKNFVVKRNKIEEMQFITKGILFPIYSNFSNLVH